MNSALNNLMLAGAGLLAGVGLTAAFAGREIRNHLGDLRRERHKTEILACVGTASAGVIINAGATINDLAHATLLPADSRELRDALAELTDDGHVVMLVTAENGRILPSRFIPKVRDAR